MGISDVLSHRLTVYTTRRRAVKARQQFADHPLRVLQRLVVGTRKNGPCLGDVVYHVRVLLSQDLKNRDSCRADSARNRTPRLRDKRAHL